LTDTGCIIYTEADLTHQFLDCFIDNKIL